MSVVISHNDIVDEASKKNPGYELVTIIYVQIINNGYGETYVTHNGQKKHIKAEFLYKKEKKSFKLKAQKRISLIEEILGAYGATKSLVVFEELKKTHCKIATTKTVTCGKETIELIEGCDPKSIDPFIMTTSSKGTGLIEIRNNVEHYEILRITKMLDKSSEIRVSINCYNLLRTLNQANITEMKDLKKAKNPNTYTKKK